MQTHNTVNPNDPLYVIVEINGVELTSNEATALRAVIDLAVDTLDKAPLDFTSNPHSARHLRRIQSLLANGE